LTAGCNISATFSNAGQKPGLHGFSNSTEFIGVSSGRVRRRWHRLLSVGSSFRVRVPASQPRLGPRRSLRERRPQTSATRAPDRTPGRDSPALSVAASFARLLRETWSRCERTSLTGFGRVLAPRTRADTWRNFVALRTSADSSQRERKPALLGSGTRQRSRIRPTASV